MLEDEQTLQEQKELKEIEAMLAQKMINELKFEKPSLIQKIIGKQTSAQLPIQGIEVPKTTPSKSFIKLAVFIVLLIAALGFGYWFLNPYLNIS